MDAADMERLYDANKNLVYRAAVRYAGDKVAAEDFMQIAFLELMQNIGKIKDDKHAEYWLLCTVKNLILNNKKKMKSEISTEDIIMTSDQHMQEKSAEDNFLLRKEHMDIREFYSLILRALEKENENWFLVFTLLYCERESRDEVAQRLGINKDALYSMIYRMRQWIIKNFGEQYQKVKK